MPLAEQNMVIIALSANANNLERLRRLGFIMYTEGLTGAQRSQIWNGTLAYDTASPLCDSYLSRYSSDGGDTHTHYLGAGQLSAAVLSRLAARIGDLSALNARYAVIDAETWILSTNHNVPPFAPLEGTVVSIVQLLGIVGLTQLKPSGGGFSIKT